MAFFNKKKEKDKEGKKTMSTLDQVRKAYEDLSDDDKKTFHQSIADRVHESIAAQERAEGDADSQSAEAREHEALGAEHAAGRGDTAELHERDDTAEERREDARDARRDDELGMRDVLDKLDALIARMTPAESDRMDEAKHRYGISSRPIKEERERVSPEEAMRRLRER